MNFEPAVYEHAAKLIGKTAWEVSRDEDLLARAHAAAHALYGHRVVVVGIDIYNLEAEAYGGAVARPEGDAIPAIAKHPAQDAAGILALPSFDPAAAAAGRIPAFLRAAARLRGLLPGADIRIPVSGPFSLASNLIGLENLLCDCMTDPALVSEALQKLADDQLRFCRAISAAGAGIALFESAASPPLVPPALFRELVLPALSRLTASTGASCIIGGDTLPIIEDIIAAGARYVICPGPAETDQSAFMRALARHPQITVRVNMNPAVFCNADPAPALAEARRAAAIAAERERQCGRARVCVGSGVLPYEAVPETVLRVKDLLNVLAYPHGYV